jgi:hypothetical protein
MKPLENEIVADHIYLLRNGQKAKLYNTLATEPKESEYYHTMQVIEGEDEGVTCDVHAWGGYYSTDDDGQHPFDVIKDLTEEAKTLQTPDEKMITALASEKSALEAQLAAATERYYALEAQHREVNKQHVDDLAHNDTLLTENIELVTRHKLLSQEQEGYRGQIAALSKQFETLVALHDELKEDYNREKAHVNSLVLLLDFAMKSFGSLPKKVRDEATS